MKKVYKILFRIILAVMANLALTIFGLYITGHGYIIPAVRSTYLKGYTTAYIDDHIDFKNAVIKAGTPQSWPRHELYNRIQLSDTLRKELEDFRSIGFAIFKDGYLLYEEYWDGYSDISLTNSFSMAKTVTTMLIGKAIEQGYIKSLDQPITDFLPEFLNDPFGKLCTIGNLSAMRSGFDWMEDYKSPFNPTTEAYYGNDIERMLLKRRFSEKPGGHFRYCSADTQLLAIILKRATGKSLANYLSDEFWKPLGMEQDALWSLSGEIEKSFCCLNSNVRDFAKLGQLLLQKGSWNGMQLLDSAFTERMITADEAAFKPGEPQEYGYSLWLDNRHQPAFYAFLGHLGQRIIIVPEANTVIVRLGKEDDQRPLGKGHLDTDIYYFVDETMKMCR
ncbi:MAG: beta-lactamase family protein [Tannerella sp.]|jgi:CubicO group peptidase (beta-lactamase class C family)|nr:beta-lactamase family protein [Tannerella sp.]